MSETVLEEHYKNKNMMFEELKRNFKIDIFHMFNDYLRTEYYNCDWIKKNYKELYLIMLNYLKKEKNIMIRNQITDFLLCIQNDNNVKKQLHDKKFILGKKNDDIFLYSTSLNKCVNLKNFDNRYEHFIFRTYDKKSLCILYKFFIDNTENVCILYNCSFLKNLSNSPQKKLLRKLCRERIKKCPSFFICNKKDFGFFIENNKRRVRTKLFISMMNKQGSKGLRVDKNKFKKLDNIILEPYEIIPKNFLGKNI